MNAAEIQKFVEELRRYGTGNGGSLGRHMGIMDSAADTIESLQAQLDEEKSRRYQAECNYDHAVEDRNGLRAQLKAAVEDLEGAGACFTCKHFRRNGGDCFGAGECRLKGAEIFPCNEPGVYRVEVPDDGRNTYVWRGPQAEGGE